MFAIISQRIVYNISKGCGSMIKKCEICDEKFETKSKTRLYCYKCSGVSARADNETRKHQKTILRRSMKLQAIKLLGEKCSICGDTKYVSKRISFC